MYVCMYLGFPVVVKDLQRLSVGDPTSAFTTVCCLGHIYNPTKRTKVEQG
jgi:hypothetical protein